MKTLLKFFGTWYSFAVRHETPHFFDRMLCEGTDQPMPVYRTSGKVQALTERGARRLIRKRFRYLIEIVEVRN